MSELEIPARTVAVTRKAMEELYAAAYRALALKYERHADVVLMSRDGSGQDSRIALLDCAARLRKEADKIDPPVVGTGGGQMIELKIPGQAWDAAAEAQEIGGNASDAIQVAAPIIVAAELRRLANENDPVARIARVWLSERANELDPPVVGA